MNLDCRGTIEYRGRSRPHIPCSFHLPLSIGHFLFCHFVVQRTFCGIVFVCVCRNAEVLRPSDDLRFALRIFFLVLWEFIGTFKIQSSLLASDIGYLFRLTPLHQQETPARQDDENANPAFGSVKSTDLHRFCHFNWLCLYTLS